MLVDLAGSFLVAGERYSLDLDAITAWLDDAAQTTLATGFDIWVVRPHYPGPDRWERLPHAPDASWVTNRATFQRARLKWLGQEIRVCKRIG